jgi:hypothetical protein
VCWVSVQLFFEAFLILRTERDIVINVHKSWCKVLIILLRFSDFSETVIFSTDRFLKKYSDMKFHEHPSNGSLDVPCGLTDGRTDRCDEANSRLLQFYERV